jgi:uncharacterized glyoxalase superfamily protein PhnB
MSLTELTPNILVEDMAATLAFYQEVLGFGLVMSVPDSAPFNWAMLKRDEVVLMFQTRASLAEEIPLFASQMLGGGLTFYINVTDIQGLHQTLAGRVEVVMPMKTTFYGAQEFGIRDPNGFVLVFAQSTGE